MGYARQLVVWAVVLGVVCAFTGAAMAQDYPVRFVRADKTGQKTTHEVTLEKTVTRTKAVVGDAKAAVSDALTSNRLVVAAQFTREVVEAPNSDHPVTLLVTFQKLTLTQQEKAPRAVLPAGTQVRATAYKGDPLVFEGVATETGPAPALDEVSLAMLGMLVQIPEVTDDECFGTQDKKGAGSAWPVNQEALGKTLLGGVDSQTAPDSVTGSVKLEKVEKVDGVECAVVSLSYATTYKPAAQEGPMDVKDMGSKLIGNCRLVAPIDGVSPLRGKSSDVTSTAVTHVIAPGNTVEVKLLSRTKRDETVKVVKK